MSRRIPLQRLADDDCRNLADRVVADKQLPSQLLEQIVARSDGVPLFVEELAAAALETGQVDPGTSTSVGDGGHGVPSALYDFLMLRLERLGEAKAIAQLASVIGRSFSHQLLAAIASEHGNALQPALARLLESGLIRLEQADDEKAYTFKHALVRDVAYYSLLKRQRRELHARRRRRDRTPPAGNFQQGAGLPCPTPVGSRTHRRARCRCWLKAAAAIGRALGKSGGPRATRCRTGSRSSSLPAGPERDDLELERPDRADRADHRACTGLPPSRSPT